VHKESISKECIYVLMKNLYVQIHSIRFQWLPQSL
jgi:hypothetical protein